MPYINADSRKELDPIIDQLIVKLIGLGQAKSGNLNYAITRIVSGSYSLGTPRYHNINDAIGVLECIKQEMYARIQKYELLKIRENGDVREYEQFEKSISIIADDLNKDKWKIGDKCYFTRPINETNLFESRTIGTVIRCDKEFIVEDNTGFYVIEPINVAKLYKLTMTI